jgi:hypothetical protein
MNFTIDESKRFDVTIRSVHSYLDDPENPTADDLIKILKGVYQSITISNDDSPEFKALRNQLESEGYIECQRSWWNGDCVLKPFTLNGVKFEVNGKFCCGAAMNGHLKFEREYENKRE